MSKLKEQLEFFLGKTQAEEFAKHLPEISDPHQLIKLWSLPPQGSKREKLVEKRISKICSDIHNIDLLIQLWKEAPPMSKPRELIKKRILEIVNSIQVDKIPEWFEKMITGEKEIPWFIENEIRKKAEKLYNQLCFNFLRKH